MVVEAIRVAQSDMTIPRISVTNGGVDRRVGGVIEKIAIVAAARKLVRAGSITLQEEQAFRLDG